MDGYIVFRVRARDGWIGSICVSVLRRVGRERFRIGSFDFVRF